MFYSATRAKKSMNTIKFMPLIPMELYPLGSRGQLLDICGNNKRQRTDTMSSEVGRGLKRMSSGSI